MITSFFEDFMSKIYIPSISVIDIIEIAVIVFDIQNYTVASKHEGMVHA